ncbi:ParB/RepB/Spo0J family partition protein [Mycobacterium sp. TY815]|uniref:ParB/RepB/Spo0J family partition protein n=1 Tax=Mycobacterium sp. TY815 TaxID=3050581 RepID=UPI0027416013|nr:ParB/RepB/Spo0J family partition protein [Mycobacterium sp. TY815]MDP7707451.1 ParB/RepB/Spo0J family partition protein [Mycobacterium sp. TY815]
MTPSSTALPPGVFEHLDPQTLELEDNVRADADTGAAFAALVASVRQFGVLSALLAVRTSHGVVTVRDGQRRLLAARAAGLSSVPVYVRPDAATTVHARAVERITEQIVANDHRAALTESERAKGIQQLLLEGLTPAKVARSLTVSKATVEAAAITAASEPAMAALSANQLTIEQAAALADFDDDPETLRYLTEAATAGDFDHRVSEARQKVATAAARARTSEALCNSGYRLLDERPSWTSELFAFRLDRLRDTEGNRAPDELPAQQPQLWAIWLEEVEIYRDTRTGIEVDEGDIDWDIEAADHDAVPDEGYVHPRFIAHENAFQPEYYCLDVAAAGLQNSPKYSPNAYNGSVHSRRNDQSAEDVEARKEADRREKRKVIALNKLGLAAIEVRRAWVKSRLLARKAPPVGGALFVATQLSKHPGLLTGHGAAPTAAALLGLDAAATIADAAAALPLAGDARATVLTLGLVLGALEAETPKDAWRRSYCSYGKHYLRFLSDNGYELAEIEKVITCDLTADVLYDRIVADQKASAKAS